MTLTLSPEIERLLNRAAAEQGRTPEELAEEAVLEKFVRPQVVSEFGPLGQAMQAKMNTPKPNPLAGLTPEEREERRQETLARIRSGYFKSRLSSSEEFMARKAEEKALEESHEEKKARIYALMGSSSHLGPSRLIQDKAEEIAREDRRL